MALKVREANGLKPAKSKNIMDVVKRNKPLFIGIAGIAILGGAWWAYNKILKKGNAAVSAVTSPSTYMAPVVPTTNTTVAA